MAQREKPVSIEQISAARLDLMEPLLAMFARVFEEPDTYTSATPRRAHLRKLLDGDSFIALAALNDNEVVGGLAAYELQKFEQERSEIYIYDLAVEAHYRRRGIATALISELKAIAVARKAYLIFVQADQGDDPAISLYSKLGKREDILHFDIPVQGKPCDA